MKKIWIGLMVLALVGFWAQAGFAEIVNSDEVTVTVQDIKKLSVPGATGLTLNALNPTTPTEYAQASVIDGDGLKYTHNSEEEGKITASAEADVGTVGNDITLTVAIEGQTAHKIVDAGTDQSDVELWTGIPTGSHEKDLTWTADGSVATTKTGTYTWIVTFTATNQQ